MKAVIGRWYKTYRDAEKFRLQMEKLWSRRIKFWVISDNEGNLVIGESFARKCFPDLFPPPRKPSYTKNYKGRLIKNPATSA